MVFSVESKEANSDQNNDFNSYLTELQSSNYLVSKIQESKTGAYVFLNEKYKSNPNDTKNVIYDIVKVMKSNSLENKYTLKIWEKTTLLYSLVKSDTDVVINDFIKKREESQKLKSKNESKSVKKKSYSKTPSAIQLKKASHNAIQNDCMCTILEWDSSTFEYSKVEGDTWETLENFVSKYNNSEPKSLCAYVKLRYSSSTGSLQVIEVDYYSPDLCD